MAKIWGNAVKVDKNEKRKYIILNIFKNVSQQYIFGSYFFCVCICEIYENKSIKSCQKYMRKCK